MKNNFIKNKNDKPLPKKAKKMSLSQVITLLLMIFWTLTSILTIALTFKSCNEEKAVNNNVAYADSLYSETGDVVYNDYSFYGNDLFYLSAYRYNTSGQWDGVDFIKFNVNFMSTYDTKINGYKTRAFINAYKYDETTNSQILNAKELTAYFVGTQLFEDRDLYANGNLVFNMHAYNSTFNFPVLYYMNGDFNSNVKFIQIGSSTTYIDVYPVNPNLPLPNFGDYNINVQNTYTYLRYIDNNGNSITFSFPASSNGTLNNRTYAVGEISENEGYILGKQEGFKEGSRIGYADGEEVGYNRGFREGKQIGINQGASEANDYTFLSLISAVIDAPIQAFKGLLSFELFGYDLSPLILSLFTLSIVIVLIKLFI